MAYLSRQIYNGDGNTKTFTIPFKYINQSHVKVYIDGQQYTNITYPTSGTVSCAVAPANGSIVLVKRETPRDELMVDFQDTALLNEYNLDVSALQTFFICQELLDDAASSIGLNNANQWEAQGKTIQNVGNPVHPTDAATKAYADGGNLEACKQQVQLATIQANNAYNSAVEANNAAQQAVSNIAKIPIRQCVLSGKKGVSMPGDTHFNFGGFLEPGTGLSVNLKADSTDPFRFTFANGYNDLGSVDYVETIEEDIVDAWTDLVPNAINYLYIEKNPDGSLSFGHTLAGFSNDGNIPTNTQEMTGYTSDYGDSVTASSEDLANYGHAWKAFNQNPVTYWSTPEGTTSAWIAYEYPQARVVSGYTITAVDPDEMGLVLYHAPKSWTFEGWNGSDWVILDTQSNIVDWPMEGPGLIFKDFSKTFTFTNSTAYTKYRLNISASNGTRIAIGNIGIHEVDSLIFDPHKMKSFKLNNNGQLEEVIRLIVGMAYAVPEGVLFTAGLTFLYSPINDMLFVGSADWATQAGRADIADYATKAQHAVGAVEAEHAVEADHTISADTATTGPTSSAGFFYFTANAPYASAILYRSHLDTDKGVWLTVGPTGSGADEEWSALNVVPTGAKAVRLNLKAIIQGGTTTNQEIGARFSKVGFDGPPSPSTCISVVRQVASVTNVSYNTVDVLLNSSRQFWFNWNHSITNGTGNIEICLVGYYV